MESGNRRSAAEVEHPFKRVSISKPEWCVLHSSPFTSPGFSSSQALPLTLPGSVPQLCVTQGPWQRVALPS